MYHPQLWLNTFARRGDRGRCRTSEMAPHVTEPGMSISPVYTAAQPDKRHVLTFSASLDGLAISRIMVTKRS
jgi:hypothetical protein